MYKLSVTIGLVLMLSGPAYAGDLGMAGALSGAGQGLGNALGMMQSGMIQQQLMEERHKQEMERLEREERYRRAREDAAEARAQRRSRPGPDDLTAERQALAKERAILAAETVRLQEELALLKMERLQPDWRTIVGAPGSQTAYRLWLKQQPRDYQQLIENTTEPDVLSGAITRFKQDTATR